MHSITMEQLDELTEMELWHLIDAIKALLDMRER